MKNLFSTLTSLFLILALLYFSFARLLPDANYTTSGFSMDRAFSHVEQIGQNPHAVGTTKHAFVRNYIVQQLQKMGLEVQTQEGYCLSDDGILVKPIMAFMGVRISWDILERKSDLACVALSAFSFASFNAVSMALAVFTSR